MTKKQFRQWQFLKWIWILTTAFLIPGSETNCPAQNQTSAAGELRVLFIGNSLTYYNNLPEIVAELAKSAKQKKLIFKMVAEPNFSLEDHWNKGDVRKLISREKWDFVVLQQGPSASVEGRKLLLEYTGIFAKEIIRVGAKPALYMVWASDQRKPDFDRVSESYKMAADDVNGLLLPAGEAWREAWRRDPTLGLYSSDGFHPTPEGSYLAALVIYQQLYGKMPVGLPYKLKLRSGDKINLSEKQAKLMQEAAAETNKKFGGRSIFFQPIIRMSKYEISKRYLYGFS